MPVMSVLLIDEIIAFACDHRDDETYVLQTVPHTCN